MVQSAPVAGLRPIAMSFVLLMFVQGCHQGRTCNGRAAAATDAAEAAGPEAPPIVAQTSRQKNADDNTDAVKAPQALDTQMGPLAVSGSKLTLRRDALGQDFLLSPALVLASNTPIIDHGQPLVVHFEQAQDRLALFAQNHAAVYRGLPTRRLLQTFAIVNEDSEHLTFRWDLGLQSIDQRLPMAYSDWPASLSAYVEAESNVLPVDDAYLIDAHTRGDTLILHQVARVRRTLTPFDWQGLMTGGFESYPIEATVNVYFTLAPLTTNHAYTPKLSTRQRDIGYFEVATMRAGDGGLDAWATRWDFSPDAGPVHFGITSDVPDDLVSAVREGIEYWNRVAGRALLEVHTNVSPERMPDAREVIVHWIDWRQAGFARASLQPHPLTGEILRADIYLTSSFADNSAEHVADALLPEAVAPTAMAPQAVPRCAYASAASAAVRSTFDVAQMSQTRIRRAVADNIRLVVAHEVGHTLGLRHNFGASMQSLVPTQHKQSMVWQAYLRDEAHTGAATATSVMDYLGGADGFLLGAYIQQHALAYDKAAIDWGYSADASEALADAPMADAAAEHLLFCTDIERSEALIGCEAHDSGQNPIAGYLAQAELTRQALPRWIINRFIDGLHPEYAGDAKTPQQIVEQFDFDKHAMAVAYWGRAVFTALQDSTRVLPVERALGHIRVLEPKAYKAATRDKLASWLDEMGGLPGFLRSVLRMDFVQPADVSEGSGLVVGWLVDEVVERIEAPGFADGITAQGRAYHLSAADVAAITALAPRVAAHLEQSILRDVIATLTGAAPGSRDPETQTIWSIWVQALAATAHIQSELVRPEWQSALGALAYDMLLGEDGSITGTVEGKSVSVAAPAFREDVRLASVRLLSPVVFGTPSWLEHERTSLQKELRDRIQLVAKADRSLSTLRLAGLYAGPEFVIPIDVSPDLRHWAETEMRLLDALRKVQDSSVWHGVAEGL
jgi:hypothetical protein